MDIKHPKIISASRRTDIPAFYMNNFMNSLREGYIIWKNPYNEANVQKLMFDETKFIVFWSKNPANLIEHINELNSYGFDYYVQYTLNDYDYEGYEPGVPTVEERINTFINLSYLIGKERVIWRFDPLMLTDVVSEDVLIRKITNIGNRIFAYTEKLVFSFVDIIEYSKVAKHLKECGVNYILWDEVKMKSFAKKLADVNKKNGWNLELATCAEKIDLSEFGIKRNKCIDEDLIIRLDYKDQELMDYLGVDIQNISVNLFGEPEIPENAIKVSDNLIAVKNKRLKDAGQRLLCGCCASKDIASYQICNHGCLYCYANGSKFNH